jgi:hypothetical protein
MITRRTDSAASSRFHVTARADADTGEDFLQFFACWADWLVVLLVFDTHLGTSRCDLKSGYFGEEIAEGSRIIRACGRLRITD